MTQPNNVISMETHLKEKYKDKVVTDFRKLPREFQLEPILVLLQTLADVEYLKEEMKMVGDYCWVEYTTIKDSPTNDFVDKIEDLCVGTIQTVQKYSKDIDLKLLRMKSYFPSFEDGKDIMEQCAVFAKLKQFNPEAYADEVDAFLGQVSTEFYERKYQEDSTAELMHGSFENYKKHEETGFQLKLDSALDTSFSDVLAKIQMDNKM